MATDKPLITSMITVCEIEHSGDLNDAYAALIKAGFQGVDCIGADYYHGEASFRIKYEEGQDAKAMLQLAEEEGLCR